MTRMLVVPSPSLTPLSTAEPLPTDGLPEWSYRERSAGVVARHRWDPGCDDRDCVPDGPFPFTVAVWQEVTEVIKWEFEPSRRVMPTVGAVVATVEVTGKGHRFDECLGAWGRLARSRPDLNLPAHCHEDAAPDCWHSPTSTVTRLDVPIPMERPVDERRWFSSRTWEDVPAPAWFADLDLEVPA